VRRRREGSNLVCFFVFFIGISAFMFVLFWAAGGWFGLLYITCVQGSWRRPAQGFAIGGRGGPFFLKIKGIELKTNYIRSGHTRSSSFQPDLFIQQQSARQRRPVQHTDYTSRDCRSLVVLAISALDAIQLHIRPILPTISVHST